ncbi:antibiotic biosynthesis monooxygenase [Pseudooceanicola sp. CBS1P-1]|uniref:Antibiotic biosynthesis monooxygenase n=1 Tax=Pseudooceanicola albus TaxID=2692189 RepID=A0A6L7GBL3_9RHOB|nr:MULTISPECIES: antibiotic biosynthesis monooxygenase [Pseudooceanicola]MBT9386785.1 antibiotic biosynthesis monooxygenase [Pseudooceanicola endophyticus]MXN20957.1 antibiotic biosynthesis monooxygenase [Pseudooceanicola albus]
MILELAQIRVIAGQNAAFEAAVAEAASVFARAPGCRGLQLLRGLEAPDSYSVLIGWDTLEAHTVDFRSSPLFQEWRALVGPHFAAPPQVSHHAIALPQVSF